uniref:Uncharacterized protein n=1 Tax=Cannabis sativa TaxID=3483 RepID=A0A803QPN0_CANSA
MMASIHYNFIQPTKPQSCSISKRMSKTIIISVIPKRLISDNAMIEFEYINPIKQHKKGKSKSGLFQSILDCMWNKLFRWKSRDLWKKGTRWLVNDGTQYQDALSPLAAMDMGPCAPSVGSPSHGTTIVDLVLGDVDLFMDIDINDQD